MKLYTLRFFFLFVVTSYNAQNLTVPLSGYSSMDDTYLHADVDYVKDMSGILDKFLGTWTGSSADYQYEYRVSKTTITADKEYLLDVLVIKYIIKDSSGTEIINTLNLQNDNSLVMEGLFFDDDTASYVLYYSGEDYRCGQKGRVYINVSDNNLTKMRTVLHPTKIILDPTVCSNGYVTQIMPTKMVVLTKQ